MLDNRRLLTVRLARDGMTLRRSHHLGDRKLGEGTDPWGSLGKGLQVDAVTGLYAVARLLDRGDGGELNRGSHGHAREAGEILFRTLFGPPSDWEPVLRAAFRQPEGARPPPTFDAVRLRIVTSDRDLLGMPWRLASWQGKPLVSGVLPWTFEVSAVPAPTLAVHFPRPARVLVIAPEVAELDDLSSDQHTKELREAVLAVSPTYGDPAFFRVVKTEDDLFAALRGMRPHVVYYYGHAEVLGDQAALSLAGPAPARQKRPLSMDDFKSRMSSLPLAVFVNGHMTGASCWYAVGHKLSPEVPLVIASRTTARPGYAGPAAIRWLQELLHGDHDPVALLDTFAAGSTRDFQWATTVVHTAYLSWTAGETENEPRPPIGLRLDRRHQRDAALGRVATLVRGREKRVETLIACGEPGNHVEQVGEQLFDYLETHARQTVRAKRLRLRFPDVRTDLLQGIEDEIRRALGIGEHDDLQSAFRRFLPAKDASRATPLLWIDWGTIGRATEDRREGVQRPLDALEIEEWLELCSTLLVKACPAECRIVSLLAMEIEEGGGGALKDEIEALQFDLMTDAFGCQLLPELGGLSVNDICEYLRDPPNTQCPPGLTKDMASLLYQHTRGNYEATVALIHEAEAMTWVRLKAKLSTTTNQGTAPARATGVPSVPSARTAPPVATQAELVWVHVSDLHFGHGDAAHKINQARVVEAIVRDAAEMAKKIAAPTFIFVTGDVAFSGQKGQYKLAAKWLGKLAAAVGATPAQVLAVPGNHDVDRGAARSALSRALHEKLRSDERFLDELMRSPPELRPVWAKQSAYADFAKPFGAPALSAASPFWSKTMSTALGPVTLAGLNSSLACLDDTDSPQNLVLGATQVHRAVAEASADALVIALHHHPFEWLRDADPLVHQLQPRPHLDFCGHVHRQGGAVHAPFQGQGGVRFVAGAAHGSRDEVTAYSYAWGRLTARGLDYYPRIWSDPRDAFVADGVGFALDTREAQHRAVAELPAPLRTWLAGAVARVRA